MVPIFSIKVGERLVVVVSSFSIAEECFTTKDLVLADRPSNLPNKYIGYNETTIVGPKYGDLWCNLRRLSAQEIFSTSRLNLFTSVRQDETKRFVGWLYNNSSDRISSPNEFKRVELKSKFSELVFNVLVGMIARTIRDGSKAEEFRKLINEVMKISDASNPEDFLALLRWLDYRGLNKKLESLSQRMDVFQQWLIDEHRRRKIKDTMIGHLPTLQESQPHYYTDEKIKGLVMVQGQIQQQ